MAFNRFPVSGAPSGSDEASPGAVISCRSLLLSRPNVLTRRRAYTPLISALPAQQLLGVAQDGSGEFYAVWGSGGDTYFGDTTLSVALGAGAANRITSGSVARGNQDLLSSTEFVNGGGIFFPTLPAAGCRGSTQRWLAGAPRCQDISLSGESMAGDAGDATMQIGYTGGDGVAYRAVLGYDRTGSSGLPVTVMGAPSGRYVYVRPTQYDDFRMPLLRIRLPSDWAKYYSTYNTTPFNAYLYVYRSVPSLSHEISGASDSTSLPTDPAPSDTMQLVYKTQIQAADLSAGYIEFLDICPPAAEGSPLYTNSGPNLEFTLPPGCNSLATYKDTTFYGGVTDRLVTTSAEVVQGPFVYGKSTFVVAGGVLKVLFSHGTNPLPTIVAGDVFSIKGDGFVVSGDYSVTGAISYSSGFLFIPITGLVDGSYTNCIGVCGSVQVALGGTSWTMHLSLNSATTGAINKILAQVPSPALSGVGLGVSTAAYIQLFAENISIGINATCTPGGGNITASNLATGTLDTGALQIEFRPTGMGNFDGLSIIANGTSANPYDLVSRIFPLLPGTKNSVGRRLMWSPQGQPDCIQSTNTLDIGSAEHEIMKLIGTRDALYIFKSDGLWVLSGDAGSFALTSVSEDVLLIAPSAVDAYEDVIYCLTRQGVLQIQGTSITNISLSILTSMQDALSAYSWRGGGEPSMDPIVVIASAQERSLTVSIPQISSGVWFFAIFKYAFDTGAWTCSQEAVSSYSGSGVTASEFPLMARPAIRVRGSRVFDGGIVDLLVAPILRLAAGQPYSCHAQEQTSAADGLPLVQTGPNGQEQPYEDDVTEITLTKITVDGVTKYTFSDALPSPEYDLVTAGILTADGVLHAVASVAVSDADSVMLYTVTIFPSADTYDGQTAYLLVPPPVETTFAPVGDGVQAYNFNQVGVMLSRRNSTKNYTFTYYFSDHSPFPYVAGSTGSASPTKKRSSPVAVERAAVPSSMTRGSRLTIKVSEAAPGERLELTALLVDFAAIAGEEIDYGG